jgi:serine/threonine-protein kinase
VLDAGTQIDKFTIDRVLGQGGMAIVYLVTHHALGSQHALKVLTVGSKAITERMLQEGRVQAQLRHPNVVAVHDVLDVAGQPGLLMEYVDGPSLEDFVIRTPKIDLDLARSLFLGTCDAVAHAHERGLIHRDLKPGNILLQRSAGKWMPKVTDFGLAKLVEGDDSLSKTRSGVAMGTPSYMSPEQIRDAKNVDLRSDVFAMGCILYELFTGAQAFYGDDILEIFNKVATGSYHPPRDLRPDLPRDVEAAIRGALQTDKNARIPNCETLRDLLTDGRRAEGWLKRPASSETFVASESLDAEGNPTLLPSGDAAAFSSTSLSPPENLPTGPQKTVIRPGPQRVSAETLVNPIQANQTVVRDSQPPLTELGITRTTLTSQPPPAAQSPLAWVVGGGLLVMLAMGAGVGVTLTLLRPPEVPTTAPEPEPTVVAAPLQTPEPVETREAPAPVVPAPVAPTPVAPDPVAPVSVPAAETVPVSRPAPSQPAGPTLARKWAGVAGSGERFVLEIDSQRGGTFTGTAFLRGAQIGVSGSVRADVVQFSESGGMAFTGAKTARGGWQGTFTRSTGTARAQWFLQPL